MLRHLSRALILAALALPSVARASVYQYVYNVRTSRPDLVTTLSTSTIVAGANVTVSQNANGSVTINAIGGGSGGASTLGVATGQASGISVLVSSPTALINFDQSQFLGSLQGGATSFVTIAYSTHSVTTYTAVSTDSYISANCGSACTVTLPTPVGISGKVYMIAQAGAGNVTVATAAGNISGGSTALMNQQYSELDMISDGTNWWVK